MLNTPLLGWIIKKSMQVKDYPVTFCGLTFNNHVGLAAGFDKDARYLDVWKVLGFGHVEIGTLTPLAQAGNDKPRLFRLPKDYALINRMGFNNAGVDAAIEKLKKRPAGLIVGGNIGKNKITPNEQAVNDYIVCFNKLYDFVDYFTVNVSSPNTPGLRALQDKDALLEILGSLINLRTEFVKNGKPQKPVLLKIAPDLTKTQLDDIIQLKKELNFDGIIATNTTIDRNNLKTTSENIDKIGNGGLSGKPLLQKSNSVLEYLSDNMPECPLIGVGGITSEKSALHKLHNGAGLIQLYTGFVFYGPSLIKKIKRSTFGLEKRLFN